MVNVGKPERSTEPTLRMSGYPSVAKYNSEIAHLSPNVPYFDNSECLRPLQNQPDGLIHIMDDQLEACRAPKKVLERMSAFSSTFKSNGYTPSVASQLGQRPLGPAYPARSLLDPRTASPNLS
jgi:hypothetical protein